MASKYEVELKRAQSDSHSNSIAKLSGNVRVIGLNNMQNGDIITIPAGYKVFEQDITGSEQKAQYIIVNVKRNGEDTALRFYPSSFYKMGTEAKKQDDGTYARGSFLHAQGTVVDKVQEFGEINEAVDALVGTPFTVGLTPCDIVTYEAREKDTLTKDDVRHTNMPEYNF